MFPGQECADGFEHLSGSLCWSLSFVSKINIAMGKAKEVKNFIFAEHLIQLILLVIAAFITTSWINFHFEGAVWLSTLLYLITLLYSLFGLLAHVSTPTDGVTLKSKIQKGLLFVLKPSILIILYIAIFTGGNFFSTVKVYSDGVKKNVKIYVAPEGTDHSCKFETTRGENDKAIFFLTTNPFGKSYYIQADGYLRKSFEVYPWVGKRIRLNDDLRPAPSLYLRLMGPPVEFNKGIFVIKRDEHQIDSIELGNSNHGALLLGMRRTVLKDWKDRWHMEMTEIVGDSGPELRSAILNGWNNYLHYEHSTITPGNLLKVSFVNHHRKILGSIDVIITEDAFQDYLIPLE